MNVANLNPGRLRRIFSLLALVVLTGLPHLCPALAAPTEGRYLFIVETSAGMRRRAENVQATLGKLVTNGLNGQLAEGDTIGLWTFNEELYAGQFPLQKWTSAGGQRIAAVMMDYLQKQASDKPANLAKALEAMAEVVKKSEKITVVLVTDGASKISGTPYDTQINDSFRLNAAEQQKARMPFITVLRARKGEFTGTRVSTPPWPIDFPPFPVEPDVAPVVQVETKDVPAVKVEPKTEPPVITETPTPPTPPVQPVEVSVVPQPATVIAAVTNSPPPAEPVVTPTPPPVEAPVTVSPPKSDPVPPPVEVPKTQVPPVTQTPTEPPPPPVPVEQKPAPAPEPPAPPTTVTKAAPKAAPPSVGVKAPPAQTAAALPPVASGFKRTNLLIGGIALVIGAGILLIAQLRRPRRMEKISLITHAVEREEK